MDELARMMQGASEELQPACDEARVERAMAGVRRRERRRAALRAGATSVVLLVGLGMGLMHFMKNGESHGAALLLADGSQATPIGADSELLLVRDAGSEAVVDLVRGAGRFDVVPNPSRTFRVRAGEVIVEVLGTSFEVTRDENTVHVTVMRGRVRVSSPKGEQVIVAGEQLALARSTATAPEPKVEPTQEPAVEPAGSDETPNRRWRALVQSGRFEEAYKGLQKAGEGAVRDIPHELMDAADAARLSGHARESTTYLRQVVDKHATDPLAPFAAFTLGRVLLDNLGEPRRAAEYLRKAQQLALDQDLVEDALAREVEAWMKAGAPDKAHERAEAYMKAYPKGRRVHAVRTYGGLD